MPEQMQFAFNLKQVEALIRALERCGVNSGNYAASLEYFNDTELVSAAKVAHGILRGKGQREARSRGRPEVTRDLHKEAPAGDLREAYRVLRGNYVGLLSDAGELLRCVRSAKAHLEGKLDVQKLAADRAAIAELDSALMMIDGGESGLAQTLERLEHEDWEKQGGRR